MDKRKVEMYLLEGYKTREVIGTFEKEHLCTARKFSCVSLIAYAWLLGTLFFDSWNSFVLFFPREVIYSRLVAFVLFLIPVCTLATILFARFRISRMEGVAPIQTSRKSVWLVE